jgi:periplasmic mercuric ion binding protein
MKKLFFAIIVLGFALNANAQQPKPLWVTIKSENLKCWECKVRLEEYMVRANGSQMESGMIQRKYNLMKGELRVQYWPDRTNPNLIKTVMANAGFDADEIKASEEAYKILPPACKRAAEGGGPKKGKPCHTEPVN